MQEAANVTFNIELKVVFMFSPGNTEVKGQGPELVED